MVTDQDLGWNTIMREIRNLDGMEVSAGILRDSGNSSKGPSYVDIATWNEYGTRRIPSRPFVRIASDDNRKAWGDLAERCVGRVISRSMSKAQVGEAMGERMKEDIQKVFGDKSKLVPNAPSTIRRKGHDKPLIDTGKLKSVTNYRIDG